MNIKLYIDDKEFDRAIKKLNGVLEPFVNRRERRAMLRRAGKPLLEKAKENISLAEKPISRYSTPKVIGYLKAPKGSGKISATYYPGNLRESIKNLTFRKSNDIFVGPKVYKKKISGSKGLFGPGRGKVDGYYAHFVEYGTINAPAFPYMMPAYRSTNSIVLANIIREVETKMNKYINRNKV